MSLHYDNLDQIAAVVHGFESCSTGKEDFNHARHLSVALWYLNRNTFEQAANQMRAGLFRFIEHHDVPREKYNETITLFWLRVVQVFIERRKTGRQQDGIPPTKAGSKSGEFVNLANELLQTYRDASLAYDYYSRERASSPEAKAGWLEPDMKPFDF